jgi:circadian clock protein KaiC
MRSIGLRLQPWVDRGLLRFHNTRSTHCGLEMHLATIQKLIRESRPSVIVVDPIDSLVQAGTLTDATMMVTRLIDFLKGHGITALFTNLITGGKPGETSGLEVSSLVDTWLLLRDVELAGERNRVLYLLKSRGMAHSNQLREFLLTDHGIELIDVYTGPGGVLTGSLRVSQEAREKAQTLVRQQEVEAKRRHLATRREALEARIAAMRKEFEAEEKEMTRLIGQERARAIVLREDHEAVAIRRQADVAGNGNRRNDGSKR